MTCRRSALSPHPALNALRETQLEQGRAIIGLEHEVAGLDQKLAGLDQKVTEGFATLGTGMAQITALLTPNAGSEQE